MYILYFLTSLFRSLVVLSKGFQQKYVDVATIGSLVRIMGIAKIRNSYVIKNANLNQET